MLARVAILLCLIGPSLSLACPDPLRVFVNDWPPYVNVSGQDDNLTVSGQDVRVLKALARQAGCPLEWVELPVDRAHPALRAGKVDILLAASRIPSRESYAWFSLPYRQETIAVVGSLAAPAVSDWEHVLEQSLILAAPRRGWYGKGYERYRGRLIENGQLSLMNDYRSGVAMLKAGRVDLVMGDLGALEAAARHVEMVLSRPLMVLSEAPVHLMYSRSSVRRETVRRLNAVLSRWREDGTLESLNRGYRP